MGAKKLALATLAGGVSMSIDPFAGIWHEIVAVMFYTRETEANHEGVVIIFLAYLVLGLLMAYLYPLVDKGGTTVIHKKWKCRKE